MNIDDVASVFKQEMNKHGYGFQYAVLAKIKELYKNEKSKWWPLVSEFPVDLKDTKIDFILRYKDKPLYIIAECKRVNPALANWCFVKANASNSFLNNHFYAEILYRYSNSILAGLTDIWESPKIYNVALEAKSNTKGDESGKGRGIIEEAATQVCRGLNGLIKYYRKHDNLHQNRVNIFIPAIFTTANIFVSDINIESTDINTGEINLKSADIKKENWIHYHYPQTPTIKHDIPSSAKHIDIREIIYNDYIKDIPIINSLGIEEFLCNNPWEEITYMPITTD